MNFFENLENIPSVEKMPGFHGKFSHTERMTLAKWRIEAGSILPQHNHEHEQLVILLRGEFEMKVGEEVKICKPGDIVKIPSMAFHSGKALTDCEIIDIFQPVREDFK
ncbi:MAG: cupin domain-containing protein [Microscillaceae bacterium]|nr:cupin domain-containing protein [Microscillaceae bacterium]